MRITNAHQNNLKNIDLTITENRLIIIMGLSGSGKSLFSFNHSGDARIMPDGSSSADWV
jgi:excinuclease UvrABC ATPase subunit